MDVLLAAGSRTEAWIFILLPCVILVLSVVVLGRRYRQETKDWTPIGGGLLRLKIDGGWMLRRRGVFAMRDPMTFVPDPDHQHPPDARPS